mmetsp:Transcript_1373/g.3209  ORF Transcript_1373/g.3209 Transcript_1373/m.3209 type:complete len:403 (-) Transcript_1373:1225-2433(-)
MRVLPRVDAALGVRHHGEVAAVGGAHGGDAVGGAVGAVRVGRSGRARGVHVAHGQLARGGELLHHAGLGEERLALAVRHPHAHRGAGHALEHDGGRLTDGDLAEAALEAAAVVVHKAGLVSLLGHTAGHPAEQRHELAAVADAEGEGVGALVKGLKLLANAGAELDAGGPALGAVHHVGVREAAHKDDATEAVQGGAPAEQVAHGDVPRLHTRCVHRRRHLAVAVAALLAQDGNADLVGGGHDLGQRPGGREAEVPHWVGAARQASGLCVHALLRRLPPLQHEGGRLPGVAQHGHALREHRLAAHGHRHALVGGGGADRGDRKAGGAERRDHRVLVLRGDLHQEAQLLCKQRGQVAALLTGGCLRQVQAEAGVAGKRHLERRHHQAAVAHVVAGADQASVQQ